MGTGGLCNSGQQVSRVEQHVNIIATQGDPAILCGNQAILSGMGQLHRRIDSHNPRRAFDRVGGPHQGLNRPEVRRVLFQRNEPLVEHLHVSTDVFPEQIQK
jgi:hypothetical protein